MASLPLPAGKYPAVLASLVLLLAGSIAVAAETGVGDSPSRFVLELEAGPAWQSRNDVRIPNDESATRFSLDDLAGSGPVPAGRLYVLWNMNDRHGLRALLAPLSYTKTGTLTSTVNFAGATFQPGIPTDATYKFNSFRLGYRYNIHRGHDWRWWIGFTAKLRDAKIELAQGETAARKTDLGFVPLLHLAGEARLGERWSALLDVEGLAGGPGRAVDGSLKLRYDLGRACGLAVGYRTVEGGADVDAVYSFAWLHYATASVICRF
jgi:hypothetical protein